MIVRGVVDGGFMKHYFLKLKGGGGGCSRAGGGVGGVTYENGMSSSNCIITFNLPPCFNYKI